MSDEDKAAVRGLQSPRVKIPKGEALVQPGAGPHFVLDGWGCQTRRLPSGRNQIFALVLPGDAIGQLTPDHLDQMPLAYQALTPVTVVELGDLCASRMDGPPVFPGVLAALRASHARRDARLLDHIVRLSAPTAYQAVAHLLLELHERQDEIGFVHDGRFACPIGLDRLGEVLGLSSVHVHRTLAKLKQDGNLRAGPGWFALPHWRDLAHKVDYAHTLGRASEHKNPNIHGTDP